MNDARFSRKTTLVFWLVGATFAAASDPVDFARDVRPILSDHCFACHGFDAASRQADLRLDDRDAAAGVLDMDGALLERISHDDPDVVMPPPEFGKPLTPKQIATLQRWVQDGAAYTDHWAFRPIAKVSVPDGDARTPIDAFIDRQLRRRGLDSSPPASPHVLARRVALDLIGLQAPPPVRDAYLSHPTEVNYRRLVDRLLADPDHGQHRATFWLDAARYGDTHGMARDDERSIWPYRDWVVDAINDAMPFDQFTIEQLAGDYLADDHSTGDKTAEASYSVATGFLRCNVSTAEGGSIDQELRVRYAADRTETMGTAWLGLTVGCAACHDHKFDPISQRAFYELTAFFADIDEEAMNGNALSPSPVIAIPSPEQAATLARLQDEIAQLNHSIDTRETAPASAADDSANVPTLTSSTRMSPTLTSSTRMAWHRKTFRTDNNSNAYYDSVGPPPERIDLDASWTSLSDDDVTIVDDNCATYLVRDLTLDRGSSVAIDLSSGETLWKPFRVTIWAIDSWADHSIVHWRAYRQADVPFEQTVRFDVPAGTTRIVVRVSQFGGPVRARVSMRAEDVRPHSNETRTDGLRRRRRALIHQRFEVLRRVPVSMIVRHLDQARPAHVLQRGAYDQPGDRVSPAVFRPTDAFPPMQYNDKDGTSPTRLDLARWLMHPDHPLTARVAVNRIWQQCFGVGLVETAEDFGTQGSYPTHPELLDYLALHLINSRWDVKGLIRMIVTSDAYRRDGRPTDNAATVDPLNRFLATGPRARLSGEQIRDLVLQSAGLLDRRIGGRGVKPPQPPGLWRPVSQPNSSTVHFVADSGGDANRRSLYTFFKRTAPPPMMQTFDAPTRESCRVRRGRTNTPLQALAMMNDRQMFDAARAMIRDLEAHGYAVDDGFEHPARWVDALFDRVLGRRPDAAERSMLSDLFRRYQTRFLHHPDSARLIVDGDTRNTTDRVSQSTGGNHDATRAAAVMSAHTVLNLSELVSKP